MLTLLLSGCMGTHKDASCGAAEGGPLKRLFLEQVSDDSALVTWRGPPNSVCIEPIGAVLHRRFPAYASGRGFQARLKNLTPDTTYRYLVEGTNGEGRFRTAPAPGKLPVDGTLRLWILGDSGTVTELDESGEAKHPGEQAAVRDGFLDYLDREGDNDPVDLVLLLGDNAYPSGTDAQWQGAYFDMYADLIRGAATVPTIGNHEMGTGPFDLCTFRPVPQCERGPVIVPIGGASQSDDPASYDSDGDGPDGMGLPYLDIFTLPQRGEWGGVPSYTEQYYALDYGNLHVVSLDSQLSVQSPEQLAAMRRWLVEDLSANRLSWTIVFFHHSPFSKGENHDSDLELREIRMRETFAPVFDQFGVDVVFSGHAHSYERSWYLGGHYGPSDEFDPTKHVELNETGEPSLGQGPDAYPQISRHSGSDDKVVYTVAGSAGKAGHFRPCELGQTIGCTKADWLSHPAHRTFDSSRHPDYVTHGIARLGSVLLEATAQTLTSRFIDDRGQVLDYFVIRLEPGR